MNKEMRATIREDFEALQNKEELCTSKNVEFLLHMQSVEGHAHNGHSLFHKHRYVDITMGQICEALGENPVDIRNRRQILIDEVKEWIELAQKGKPRNKLVNSDGKPLFRVSFLPEYEVDYQMVLKGIYYGGMRDDSLVRERAEKKYGVTIGGGECYPVDTRVLKEMGLNGDIVAHGAYADRIDEWKKRGLIVAPPEKIDDNGPIQFIYIRHREGPGHSDDLAIIFSGILCGFDAAFGAFLADATDTMEKFSNYFADQDSGLSQMIKDGFPDLELDDEILLNLARMAAVPVGMEDDLPDSSARYMLRRDKKFDICPLENHINYLRGRATVNIPVGIGHVPAVELYEYVRTISAQMVGASLPAEFEPARAAIGLASKIMDKNIKYLPLSASLRQIADALAATRQDFVIIIDEAGKPVGAVHARDLVGFMKAN